MTTNQLIPSVGSKREVPRDVRNSKVWRQDKFRRDWCLKAVATPNDRSKLVRNRSFWWRLCVITLLSFSLGIGDFAMALSQISSFFFLLTFRRGHGQ